MGDSVNIQARIKAIAKELQKGISRDAIDFVISFCEEYSKENNAKNLCYFFDNPNNLYPQGYYVYLLINPFTGEVFYAGKGSKNRAWQHEKLTECNIGKNRIIKYILRNHEKPLTWVLKDNLSEGDAYLIESYLINNITGLTNLSIPKNPIIFDKKECSIVEVMDVESEDISLNEIIDKMYIVIANGWRLFKDSYLFHFKGVLYDFKYTIHLMPKEYRK